MHTSICPAKSGHNHQTHASQTETIKNVHMHHMHTLCVYNKRNITKPQLKKKKVLSIWEPLTVKCSKWERESIFCRLGWINGSSPLLLHLRPLQLLYQLPTTPLNVKPLLPQLFSMSHKTFKEVPYSDFHFTPLSLFLFFLSYMNYCWVLAKTTQTSVSAVATVLLRGFCGDNLLWQKMLNQPLHLSSFPAGDRANEDLETTRRKWVMIVSS